MKWSEISLKVSLNPMVFGLPFAAALFHDVRLYLYFPCEDPKRFLIIRSDMNQKAGWSCIFLGDHNMHLIRRKKTRNFGSWDKKCGGGSACVWVWADEGQERERLSWGGEQRWHGSPGNGTACQRKVLLVNLMQPVQDLAVRLTVSTLKPDGRASSLPLMVHPFWFTVTDSPSTG